jgi:hypothetical protein
MTVQPRPSRRGLQACPWLIHILSPEIVPHFVARSGSKLRPGGSRLKQTGGLVRATRHLRAADVVECEVGKIGVPIQSVASEPGGALQQGGPCHAEPP